MADRTDSKVEGYLAYDGNVDRPPRDLAPDSEEYAEWVNGWYEAKEDDRYDGVFPYSESVLRFV